MITILLNGQQRKIHSLITITDLLAELELNGKRVAVEVNMEIVPRSNFTKTTLQSDDRVEIVHAIGGG